MIRALGALQILERGRVLGLPLEPARQPRDRLRLARAGALDPERIAGVVAQRARDPLAVALDGRQTISGGAKSHERHRIHGPAKAGRYVHGPAKAGLRTVLRRTPRTLPYVVSAF